jgi:hypothetical protein
MTTQTANIVVSATDKASAALMSIAGRMEKINQSVSRFGKFTGLSNVAAAVLIAYVFHFPPSELWAMPLSEMEFWANEAEKIVREFSRSNPG